MRCVACCSPHLAALQVGRLPVFFKQHSCRFYSAWAFSVPQMVLRFPYSLAEATLWASIVYWIVSVLAQGPLCHAFADVHGAALAAAPRSGHVLTERWLCMKRKMHLS